MSTVTDYKLQERARLAEYEQEPHRKEKRRIASATHAKEQKIITTMKRLEKHTVDELLFIIMLKCGELGIEYESNEPIYKAVCGILASSRNDQNNGPNVCISVTQPSETEAE